MAKRLLDATVAAVCLLILTPLMLVIALMVRLVLGAPVLYRQVRPGLRGEPFTIYKFRSMREAEDSDGRPLPDAERLGGFGKLLRSTSLDELPELWNVLKGDMSLVGPRPLLVEYLPLYSPEQRRRHDVRPGLTGWAQVKGRNSLSWEDRFELDVWYVDNRSMWLDLKILAMTLWQVLRRTGINQDGEVTMSRFTGTGK